ncbi:MAG TPA: ATP-dependent DNA helicase RecG [Rhodanobacteraceae bacterium]|nr:MAG: ATP-dependent DNA helicase RecG [Rhodanobacteraceae bacterium]HJU26404.1 ATP-dependent DNA helicase RecG [Rhodanobacteraceae bacterium]
MTTPADTHPIPSNDPGLAPVSTLPGVGPAVADTLRRLGIERVQDLWFHLPLRYEDRTRITPLRELAAGESAQVEGVVEAIQTGFRPRPQLRVAITDASRETLVLRFFHFRRQQAQQFAPGVRLQCYGAVRHGQHGLEMVHPQYRVLRGEAVVEDTLTPVYPVTEGLGQQRLRGVIEKALARLPDAAALELIPSELLEPLGLMPLRDALLGVHRPAPDADVAALLACTHPAQQRLAFEELLAHHISLKQMRALVRKHRAPALPADAGLRQRFLEGLPFALTHAQARVAQEVGRDLGKNVPMLRLVQGDVGSGKTVVAALAALHAIANGRQTALMAPTELLAEQHLRSFRAWFEPLGIDVVWLAGKVTGRARAKALAQLAAGAPIVVGTHALMQEGVEFARLGLAIVDEQHRFGVQQRMALRDKGQAGGEAPHQLVLTATPIPRTLAMSAYADLDVSTLDELPPGRTPVRTVAIANTRRDEVVERIRAACAEGRQAYWVCTLIEEVGEKSAPGRAGPGEGTRGQLLQLQAQAAEVAHAQLCAALPELRVGLVHGRMKANDKQVAMDAFKEGRTALLVATTVIEVGVDVPNASLMVIENAERLGLAQLHQLRGRVGRGSVASTCVLLYQPPLSGLAKQRLETLRETNDGFAIAEMDLRLRGPGELLGTRQTGEMGFRVADIVRDARLMPAVQRVGTAMLRGHPVLARRLVERWIGAAARFAEA